MKGSDLKKVDFSKVTHVLVDGLWHVVDEGTFEIFETESLAFTSATARVVVDVASLSGVASGQPFVLGMS